jgi:PTH1 family peptidyl-tRNA hydrolase
MRLIVGLGNPEPRYAATRHNAGFMAVDRLARRSGLTDAPRNRFHAAALDGQIKGTRVLLLKPLTYMNHSGMAVAEAANFHKLPPSDLLVLVDDTALPLGAIRIRPGGSSGGHNGLEDIRRRLGTDPFPRLRIGVGEPRIGDHRIPQADYVLSPFTADEQPALERSLDSAAAAAETWLNEGLDAAMNRYNTRLEQPAPTPASPAEAADRPSRRTHPNGPAAPTA